MVSDGSRSVPVYDQQSGSHDGESRNDRITTWTVPYLPWFTLGSSRRRSAGCCRRRSQRSRRTRLPLAFARSGTPG